MHIGLREQKCGSSWSKTTRDAIPAIRCGVMDGDGPFTNPMRPINRSQLTTKKIVWVVTFQRSQPTGCTCKVIRFSNRSKQNGLARFIPKISEGELQMQKYLLAIIVGVGLTAAAIYLVVGKSTVAAQTEQ